MNREIRDEWIRRLRSGEYKQGHNALRDHDDNYCCLGVLMEMGAQQGVVDTPVLQLGASAYHYDGEYSVLNTSAGEWAGIDDFTARIPITEEGIRALSLREEDSLVEVMNGGHPISLTTLNDHGATFDQIADLIEKYL